MTQDIRAAWRGLRASGVTDPEAYQQVGDDLCARLDELLEEEDFTPCDGSRLAPLEAAVEHVDVDAVLERFGEYPRDAEAGIVEKTFKDWSTVGTLRRQTLREQVSEFHRANAHPVLDRPQVPADARVRLRLRLIGEECVELFEAALPNETGILPRIKKELELLASVSVVRVDLPEFADALADLDYVVEGTRLEFGIDGGPIAAEVHRTNMAKVGAGKRADDKALKPEGWAPPDIAGELRKQGWEA